VFPRVIESEVLAVAAETGETTATAAAATAVSAEKRMVVVGNQSNTKIGL